MTQRGESNPTSVLDVLKRFPWVMAVSLLGTWAGMAMVHGSYDEPGFGLRPIHSFRLFLTACLGISLIFSLALIGERFRSAWGRHLPQAVGAVLLLGYYLGLDESKVVKAEMWIRFGISFVAVHLFVSFAPFLRDSRTRAFWRYNQALFLRIIASLIFSGFLFVGLSLAIWALMALLGLDIPRRVPFDVFFLIAGVFNTWFFLAGVPGDFDALERQDSYPLSLKILSQYVFIPLVSLNVIILYAYAIKTMVDAGQGGEWPKPWIGYPFVATGLCGILSLLLLHPVREENEKPWVRAFTRWFYPAQGPLLIFLVGVLGHHAFTNGLKVDTYLFLVLAFWILGMAAYFTLGALGTFGKSGSIKAIPISLFLVCLLCSFGPWGVIGVQRYDKLHQLDRLMAANGLLRDGRFIPATPGHAPGLGDRERIQDILNHLEKTGELEVLQHRLPLGDRPDDVLTDAWKLSEFLGMNHGEYLRSPPKPKSCRNTYAFSRPWNDGIFGIRGYSFLMKDLVVSECLPKEEYLKSLNFRGLQPTDSLVYRCRDNTALIILAGQPLSISLEKTIVGLEGRFPSKDSCDDGFVSESFPDEGALTVGTDNGQMKVALQLLRLTWVRDSSDRRLKQLEFNLLFGNMDTVGP